MQMNFQPPLTKSVRVAPIAASINSFQRPTETQGGKKTVRLKTVFTSRLSSSCSTSDHLGICGHRKTSHLRAVQLNTVLLCIVQK